MPSAAETFVESGKQLSTGVPRTRRGVTGDMLSKNMKRRMEQISHQQQGEISVQGDAGQRGDERQDRDEQELSASRRWGGRDGCKE